MTTMIQLLINMDGVHVPKDPYSDLQLRKQIVDALIAGDQRLILDERVRSSEDLEIWTLVMDSRGMAYKDPEVIDLTDVGPPDELAQAA